MGIVGSGGIVGQPAMISGSGWVRKQTSMAAPFLENAVWSARLACEIEAQYPSQQGGAIDSGVLARCGGHVVSAIILSVMSIEAVINEVHADIMESYPHVIEKLPEGAAKRIRDCWSDESSTYERYKLVLCCANHEVFSVKDDIGAKARYLICLRNALVHYHSAWNPPARQKGREKMAERLIREGAFRRSPLVAERGPLFPHQILSSSCAFWAATTAEKLVREFVRRMDIARAFPRFGGDTRPIAVAGQLESQPSTPAIAGGPPSAP